VTNEDIARSAADQQPPISIQLYTVALHTLYTMTNMPSVTLRKCWLTRFSMFHAVFLLV